MGNVTGTAAATNGLGTNGLQYTSAQNDGIYGLHHSGGNATLLVARLGLGAEGGAVRAGAEYADGAVPAKENHLLFQHGNAVEFPGLPGAEASLENELDVEADVYGVEAAVELDGVDADVGPGNAGVLDPYLGGVLDDLLTEIGQKHPHVLVAVPIPAGIQNTVGFHADKTGVAALAAPVSGRGAMGQTVIGHNGYLHVVLREGNGYPASPSVQGYARTGKCDRILQENSVMQCL